MYPAGPGAMVIYVAYGYEGSPDPVVGGFDIEEREA
jgi:hypothetical protein